MHGLRLPSVHVKLESLIVQRKGQDPRDVRRRWLLHAAHRNLVRIDANDVGRLKPTKDIRQELNPTEGKPGHLDIYPRIGT